MRSKFWEYGYWFLSGYVMHIVATEKMTIFNGVFLASFAMVTASKFYVNYREKSLK